VRASRPLEKTTKEEKENAYVQRWGRKKGTKERTNRTKGRRGKNDEVSYNSKRKTSMK